MKGENKEYLFKKQVPLSEQLKNAHRTFSILPDSVIYDIDLSNADKMVYVHISNQTNGWIFYNKVMVRVLHMSINTIKLSIKKLIKFGYIKMQQVRFANGDYGGKYIEYSIFKGAFLTELDKLSIAKLNYDKQESSYETMDFQITNVETGQIETYKNAKKKVVK